MRINRFQQSQHKALQARTVCAVQQFQVVLAGSVDAICRIVVAVADVGVGGCEGGAIAVAAGGGGRDVVVVVVVVVVCVVAVGHLHTSRFGVRTVHLAASTHTLRSKA